jgi:hypothetical protein
VIAEATRDKRDFWAQSLVRAGVWGHRSPPPAVAVSIAQAMRFDAESACFSVYPHKQTRVRVEGQGLTACFRVLCPETGGGAKSTSTEAVQCLSVPTLGHWSLSLQFWQQMSSFSFFLFLLVRLGFPLGKQALYYLRHPSSPFCCGYFGDGVF